MAAAHDEPLLHTERPSTASLGGTVNERSAWFDWAERVGVLVRGTELRCDDCHAKSWRALAELVPPIGCRSCGRVIGRPFPQDALHFSYRASEPLLRTVEHDALGHVLALWWLVAFFNAGFGEPDYLYGGHPGVEFLRDGRVIGEADVLLVFADGKLAVGEYKRTARGLNEPEVEKLDRLADALGADWTFVATHDPAAECGEVWPGSAKRFPDRPRLVLVGEHFASRPVNASGHNLLAWPEDSDWSAWLQRTSAVEYATWQARRDDPDADLLDSWHARSVRDEESKPPS